MSKKRSDKYANYQELKAGEQYGVDYKIRTQHRNSPVVIVAPHGGKIEPGTSKLARAIAGVDHNLYCFEGLRRRPHRDLHITSIRFDEPRGLRVVKSAQLVVSLHGLRGDKQYVAVGGRHRQLRELISSHLINSDFDARIILVGPHAGLEASNICNKGLPDAGVQLELTRALRDTLIKQQDALSLFARAVRTAINDQLRLLGDKQSKSLRKSAGQNYV